MSSDLDRLAARIAAELAKRDAPRAGASTTSGPDSVRAAHGSRKSPGTSAGATGSSSAPPGVAYVRDNARIADFIDHTLLKPEATRAEVEKLCAEATTHHFAAVCVNPVWVPLCAEKLRGTQRVSFAPRSDGVEVALDLEYEL